MPGQIEPAHRRLALLIATSDYSDPALRQLRAPGRDASDLAEVLTDPQIGRFAVQTLINARCGELQETIEEFCADRRLDDQLLIYLSCHGVLDDRGRLYYAATDTRRQRTAATAVAAAWLNERLEIAAPAARSSSWTAATAVRSPAALKASETSRWSSASDQKAAVGLF